MTETSAPPLRIFVVENHEDTRVALQQYLEMLGHEVQSAASGRAALEALPHSNCDVLVSDIGLPDMDGWELLRTVRLPRPIYAIAMSGFGMNADRRRSQEAGFRQHLVKPFNPDHLETMLEEAAREKLAAV